MDASIRGQVEWVGFRDDERVWIATAELGAPAGLAEHDVATGARRERVITDRLEAGPPAALSRTAGLLAFADHEGVILHPLDGGDEQRIVTTRPDELAFSPAGDRLAMTWSEPGSFARVEVFAVPDGAQLLRAFPFGKQRLEHDSGPHVSVTFVGSSDRLALLLANDTPSWATLARGTVPGKKKWTLQPLLETEERVGMAASLGQALAASPDGVWVAAGNFETRALLLPAATGSEPVPLVGAEAVVTALAFSPEGRWVAAAGDGPLRLHAVPSGELLARAEAPRRCGSLAVSPNGRWLAGGCDGTLRIWSVDAVLEQGAGGDTKP